MAFLSEAQLEFALLEQLAGLGFACASDDIIGPDGRQPERAAYDEVVFRARLTATVARLIPALFRSNALPVASDGLAARAGSLSADSERFMSWRNTDGARIERKGLPEMATLIEGVFEQGRFLDLLRQTPVHARDREHLLTLLNRASGGVIFTTLQEFSPAADETDFPALTDRSNVVVSAGEAHRSQYGFKARVASKTGEIAYGFAK